MTKEAPQAAEAPRVVARPSAPASVPADLVARALRLWRRLLGRERRYPRGNVSARAALHAAGTVQLVEVRDVSAGGAGFDAGVVPRVGARVRLEVLDLPGRPAREGTIRHVTGRRAGVEWSDHGDGALALSEALQRAFPAA